MTILAKRVQALLLGSFVTMETRVEENSYTKRFTCAILASPARDAD